MTMRFLMRFVRFLVLAVSAAVVSAQQKTLTGKFDCLTAGAYTLCQNQWGTGKSLVHTCDTFKLLTNLPIAAGIGSQNSTLLSASGNEISWRTDWTWANGPNSVKTCT